MKQKLDTLDIYAPHINLMNIEIKVFIFKLNTIFWIHHFNDSYHILMFFVLWLTQSEVQITVQVYEARRLHILALI